MLRLASQSPVRWRSGLLALTDQPVVRQRQRSNRCVRRRNVPPSSENVLPGPVCAGGGRAWQDSAAPRRGLQGFILGFQDGIPLSGKRHALRCQSLQLCLQVAGEGHPRVASPALCCISVQLGTLPLTLCVPSAQGECTACSGLSPTNSRKVRPPGACLFFCDAQPSCSILPDAFP